MVNPALARIVDASLNRAREALRVLDDAARFALDDAALCEGVKALRHDLAAALASGAFGRATRLAARDIEGDVGTGIKTAGEGKREGLGGVVAAACGRLTESLRSIEEACKAAGDAAAAGTVERLRYRAYEIERRMCTLLPDRAAAPQWRVCVLLTEELCEGGRWEHVAAESLAGGADAIQLREKTLEGGELLRRAKRLVAIAREHDAAVIINDRPDVAVMSDAAGVHLGQGDLPPREVRAAVGAGMIIGVSTANTDQARAALAAGADYCGIGPMFATTTKHKPVLAGPAYARAFLADPICSSRPHLAIGGITPDNISELVTAGVRGVAVSSVVCRDPEPREVVRRLREALGAGGDS